MPDPRDLEVRLPRQGRTQAAWDRVLDAGVALLEESGYEGFTIAAICARAAVNPPAIYARVRTKKALFFAVFEHGFRPIRQQQLDALAPDRWADGSPADLIRGIVAAIAEPSLEHEAFLRVIVRRAEADREVAELTHEARAGTAVHFRDVVMRYPEALRDASGSDIDACFRVVFAALVSRIATPAALDTTVTVSDREFIADLQETAVRFLLRD